MKYLYLIRHAKSSWDNPGLADIERPLNKRGRRDAPLMGERLKKHGVKPDLIYTSPAHRARETAAVIAERVGYPLQAIVEERNIYSSDLRLLLAVIQQTRSEVERLFLVGHNYVLTDLAEQLTSEKLGNVPTCGIVGIAFNIGSWHEISGGRGEMLFFDYPKKHVQQD